MSFVVGFIFDGEDVDHHGDGEDDDDDDDDDDDGNDDDDDDYMYRADYHNYQSVF